MIYLINFPDHPFRPAAYIIWESLYYSYITISAFSLCAINIDRLVSIRNPLRYDSVMTPKVIYRIILSYWFYGAITFGYVTYLQYFELWKYNGKMDSLSLLTDELILSIFVVNVMIPTFISFSSSLYVTRVSFRQRRQIGDLKARLDSLFERRHQTMADIVDLAKVPTGEQSFHSSTATTNERTLFSNASQTISLHETPADNIYTLQKEGGSYQHDSQEIRTRWQNTVAKRNHMLATLKTSRLVLGLCVTFLLCNLPFIVIELYRTFVSSSWSCTLEFTRITFWWMTYWNSVINIFCYVISNKRLRSAMKRNIIGIKMWFIFTKCPRF